MLTTSKIPLAISTIALACVLSSCVTTEEELAQQTGMDQAAFGRADIDGNGKVSPTELAKHLHGEALAEFDLDGDGNISNQEWSSTHQNPELTDEPFNRLDKDGDGQVKEEEAVRFITEHANFGKAFKDLDKNGDGHLHWEEYADGEEGSLNITLFSVQTE